MKIIYPILKNKVGGAEVWREQMVNYFSEDNEVILVSSPIGVFFNFVGIIT